jgi:hypothetical protein
VLAGWVAADGDEDPELVGVLPWPRKKTNHANAKHISAASATWYGRES